MEIDNKTLIVIDNLKIGGIATALYNFLGEISKLTDVDLLVFDEESIDRYKIPKDVNIITSNWRLEIIGKNKEQLRQKSIFLYGIKAIYTGLAKLTNGDFAREVLWRGIDLENKYKLAISFCHDNGWKSLSTGCNYYVANKTMATKKVSFIHCDYANYGGYDRRQLDVFKGFTNIACVSNSCRDSFLSKFPELTDKCIVQENFINVGKIVALINDPINYEKDVLNFVSVCRLTSEKGIERGIRVFAKLKNEVSNKFKWTIVGDGPEREALIQLSINLGVEKEIDFVGQKDNPYIYLPNADWFLLLSYHEAAPMVFGECEIVGLPVLSTETCSAVELVKKRDIGIVVENNDASIFSALKDLLENINSFKRINHSDMINKNALIQLKSLVNEQ